ncbi:Carbon starvation protein CstA [uncultured delta proteobacterium]|uniref:Carbon starvation protein CstA n=1 Tax=uncultured delta proteobacterium TaxID=34034 RepID=A0A212JT81_9DELT|nr:Carbon starvation protein CstA [uncultured delta proteobacterium]
MLAALFIFAFVFFLVAYKFYGNFLVRMFDLDDSRKTPAECLYDGMDYCPTHPAVLMGHHFSSIAGAGPIVGPITAAAWFGWLPAYIWCLFGSAFFGGPHDMGALVASIRHDGKSMGEVVRRWIGERGRFLFLCFTILTLFLIVAVFLQLAANTMANDQAVAFAAVVYMGAAILFGMMVYRFNISLKIATIVMLPIVFGSCWLAHAVPAIGAVFALSMPVWRWILVGYIIIASLLPVWLLLQPRDYLASYFLYFAVIIGGIGMIFGSGFDVTLPAFKGFTVSVGGSEQFIWPILFVTVACGAISGFHSMVGSGTSSKQLRHEKDSLVVGYGSMLLEGLVAVIAIGTIMIAGGQIAQGGPVITYAQGFGKFGALVGIDVALGTSLGALAINSFILTTLDTATRLTRYQIQEFSGGKLDRYTSTLIAVAGALALLLFETGGKPTWAVIWPVFGAANQLVAALAFLGIGAWLYKGLKRQITFIMVPMWFMLITTLAALGFLIRDQFVGPAVNWIIVVVCALLAVLGILMLKEALAALKPSGSVSANAAD